MWGQEDTKYKLLANFWYFLLALSNLWNYLKWVSWCLYWSKESVPVPSGTTLKRNVEQLLFANLNLILFQQKRNEV